MRRTDEGRDDETPVAAGTGHRARLAACSTALLVVPLALLALAGHLPTDTVAGDLSATQLQTAAPSTTSTMVLGREAVPDPQRELDPKGVAVVAIPTTTTTTAPPPTTEPTTEAPAEADRAADTTPTSVAAAPAPTTPPTTAAPAPPPPPAPAGSVSANLDAIARCESGGNPDAYNPAGYYGAFQFSLATWHGLGMAGDPRDYTYAQQKYVALALYNRSGYSPWPDCARRLGLL